MDIVALVISICALLISLLNVRYSAAPQIPKQTKGLSWIERYIDPSQQYTNTQKTKTEGYKGGVIDAADPNTINAEWRNKTGQTEKDPLDFMKDVK